jgi:hypothetical protein
MRMLAVLTILTVLPACQGSHWGHRAEGVGTTPYQVYRPPYYGEQPMRPKFLGSYAGYNYGRAPRVEYVPPRGNY